MAGEAESVNRCRRGRAPNTGALRARSDPCPGDERVEIADLDPNHAPRLIRRQQTLIDQPIQRWQFPAIGGFERATRGAGERVRSSNALASRE